MSLILSKKIYDLKELPKKLASIISLTRIVYLFI